MRDKALKVLWPILFVCLTYLLVVTFATWYSSRTVSADAVVTATPPPTTATLPAPTYAPRPTPMIVTGRVVFHDGDSDFVVAFDEVTDLVFVYRRTDAGIVQDLQVVPANQTTIRGQGGVPVE